MKVVALVTDLMFRSKIETALGPLGGVTFVGTPQGAAGADAVVVDLAKHASDVAAVRAAAPSARIVGFASHLEREVLDQARRDGADEALPRSRFFADPAAAVRGDPQRGQISGQG